MSAERPFSVEHAKSGRSRCKDTKNVIPKGALRIGRWVPSKNDEMDAMTYYYSLEGFTNMLAKARKVKVYTADEISGLGALSEEEQQQVVDAVEGVEAAKERIKEERAAARKAKSKVKKEQGPGGSPAKKARKVKKEGPQRPKLNPQLPTTDPNKEYKPKEVATMLLAQIRQIPDMNRTLPADDDAARRKLGGFIASSNPGCFETGHFDLQAAFDACIDGGLWKPKRRAGLVAANPANQPLVTAFEELAGYAFKESVFKGNNTMKAARSLAGVDFIVDSGVPLSKGKGKLAGIGKSTAAKIDQFLETGQIEALEAYKSM